MPLDLKYTPAVPTGPPGRPRRHARRHEEPSRAQSHVDIVIEGNRIRSVVPHADSQPRGRPGRRRVEPDGDAGADRVPFASAAGLRRGAGARVAGVRHHDRAKSGQHAVRSGRRARSERGRRPSGAARLRHRLPDGVAARLLQDGDRALDVPRTSRWSCSAPRCCSTTCSRATSDCPTCSRSAWSSSRTASASPSRRTRSIRRRWSASTTPSTRRRRAAAAIRRRCATLQRTYEDVVQLFGKSGRIFCPTISGGGVRKLFEDEAALKHDPRFKLYPEWMQQQVAAGGRGGAGSGGGGDPTGGSGKMVLDVMHAGGLVVAGTDTPERDQSARRADGVRDGRHDAITTR